jgi:DNA polymerase-4
MSSVIVHADLDAFFCSVEELLNPVLRGKPFIVGGASQGRGVVSSASYAARAFGIHNAMPTAQALRLCPALGVVSVRRGVYGEYSQRVMALLQDYSRVFEQLSIDEAFLDVSGLADEPHSLALEIQARVQREIGLPVSIGVAASKLVAKIASGRAKPNGVLVIPPGDEAAFLAPMDVGELWGIGKVTATRLHAIGIRTIGQLAQAQPQYLQAVFGSHAGSVIQRAQGVDSSPVISEHDVRSISSERTFSRDISQYGMLRQVLLALCDEVAGRLRSEGLYARTVQVKLRWPDFVTLTRQTTLLTATQLSEDLFPVAEQLWLAAWHRGERVRLLGVAVSELAASEQQLSLFDHQRHEQLTALAQVTDRLRAKYGDKIIGRASLRKVRSSTQR